jgi:RimJ/RimL family protein N-acetyltransferase
VAYTVIVDRQDELGRWIANRNDHKYIPDYGTYIGLERDGKIIAVAGFDTYYGESIQTHIAIDGRINREFIWFIMYYPFDQLGVKKVIAPIRSNNEKSIRFAKHLGFELEAIIKHVYPNNVDLLFFSALNKNMKYDKVQSVTDDSVLMCD